MEQDVTDVVLHAIASSASLGVAVARESGELTFVNDAFSRACNIEKPEFIHELLPESLTAEVQAVLSSDGMHRFTFGQEATAYECLISVTTVREESHHTVIGILVPQNTDTQLLRAIGKVTGKYGHDFNNLLGSMLGASDLLEHKLKKTLGEELPVERQLRLIRSSIGKATALTAQMRGYARRELYPYAPLDLEPLLSNLLDLIKDSAVKPLEVVLEVKNSLLISGNEFQLSQALQSIMLNAVDAMKKRKDPCLAVLLTSVTFDAQHEDLMAGEYMQVVCIDHGTGMEEERIEEAFTPFFSTRSASIGGGLGLGLPMARQVVRDHGGDVYLKSLPDTGTAVQIFLPIIRTEAI